MNTVRVGARLYVFELLQPPPCCESGVIHRVPSRHGCRRSFVFCVHRLVSFTLVPTDTKLFNPAQPKGDRSPDTGLSVPVLVLARRKRITIGKAKENSERGNSQRKETRTGSTHTLLGSSELELERQSQSVSKQPSKQAKEASERSSNSKTAAYIPALGRPLAPQVDRRSFYISTRSVEFVHLVSSKEYGYPRPHTHDAL